MAQSSVEWFFQQVRDNGAGFTVEELFEWRKQAEAMHEQEIARALIVGFTYQNPPKSSKEYYAETFGKKDQ